MVTQMPPEIGAGWGVSTWALPSACPLLPELYFTAERFYVGTSYHCLAIQPCMNIELHRKKKMP